MSSGSTRPGSGESAVAQGDDADRGMVGRAEVARWVVPLEGGKVAPVPGAQCLEKGGRQRTRDEQGKCEGEAAARGRVHGRIM